jgi:hypothetical protein
MPALRPTHPTGLDWQQVPGYLTPPQLVLASLGANTQPLLSEFLEASSYFALV